MLQILAVQQAEQHWYYDVLRNTFWQSSKGILNLLDGFFSILDKIWRFKFFDNEYVNKVFSGAIIVACSWLILKVIIELIMNFIIKNDGKGSPLSIYRGIVLSIVIMFLIPSLFQFGHDFSSKLTDAVISISSIKTSQNAESELSEAIISSMIYQDETKKEDAEYISKNWKTIEINETEIDDNGKEVYKYSLNLFMIIVLSVVVLVLFFFIAIQMAKRVLEIALYKIIGPFCCTSLTSNSRAFHTWVKCSIGAFLITVVQFVSIGLLLNLFATAFEQSNILVGLFLIIGALLFIIGTPTIISSLLDQQSGTMSGLGDIQSMVAMGTAMKAGFSVAGSATKLALSATSKVSSGIGKGASFIGGGISNMFRNNKGSFTQQQKQAVKDSINRHNSHRAWQQTKDFTNQNLGSKYANNSNSFSDSIKGNFSSSRMRYDNIKNQYSNRKSYFSGRN